ncbi:MAG: triphosphoribosyl-dephospho-CoA synthase [bacterium]
MELSEPATIIAELAVKSMLYEAAAFPSPGLVSPVSTGGHDDMDFFTFIRSSVALFFPLAMCAQVGIEAESTTHILPRIRKIGLKAEEKMLLATGGANTQKGLIFLAGIISAAAGFLIKEKGFVEADILSATVTEICAGIIAQDLSNLNPNAPLTRGERFFLVYGLTGIRGEVAAGLPTIINYGLPALEEARAAGLNENDSLIHVLLAVMTTTEDTNIVGRHSLDMLHAVHEASRSIIAQGGMLSKKGREMVRQLDADFTRQRISPGGSADLAAATFFVFFLLQAFPQNRSAKNNRF